MLLREPIENVTLFSGKDYDFRARIIRCLSISGESTTWDISKCISSEEIQNEPSRKSTITRSHLGGVRKNIKDKMLPKYVRQIGTRFSKGHDNSTYGLSFCGSLVVLPLPLKKEELRAMLEKNSDVNPFYKLILSLEKKGVKYDLCDKIILQGLINGIKNNLINIASDNESIIGQSIIPALAVHFSSVEKADLRKFKAALDKISGKKSSNNLIDIMKYFTSLMISPMFWGTWSKNENAQIITLYHLVDSDLNPKSYEENLTKDFDEYPKPKYDTRVDNLNIKA